MASKAIINKVALFSLLILVFSISAMPTQYSFAASRTVEVEEDNTVTIIYRDIENEEDTPEPSISLDKQNYLIGDTAILTIDDFNGNLDLDGIDKVKPIVNGEPLELEETEVNSHVFVGEFPYVGSTSIGYSPDPPESVRAQVTFEVAESGDVILSDHKFDQNELENLPFTPVTHALNIELANGATLAESNAVVTLSYANGDFDLDESSGLLQMYYKPGPDFGWSVITLASDPDSNNQEDLTVTSDPETAFFCCPVTTGQFVLGFETGSAGGGSGGLIRPGLVLNLLAIIPGGAGVDVSPPSLHFGTPTSTEDGFGGILVTDENNNAFPLVINGKGYYLPAFSTFIEPVQVNTGQDVDLTLTFLESTGVEHVALHLVDENNDMMSDTDTIITYHKGDVTKVDPEGILADDITFSTSKEGNKYSFNFGFSFDEPTNRHLMITAWDNNKNSGNSKVFNAFEVSGDSIPDDGTSHMIYLDLGAYFITANGIFAAGEKPDAVGQPIIEYDYPDSVGRMERHDGMIYDQIATEKARASQVMADKFNLDTQTFVANDEVKPYDTSRRAAELDSPFVGHKLRDYTLTPEENQKLIKELSWIEHLKAQKILDSLLASSKYHK